MPDDRRIATLVAFVSRLERTACDDALNLMDLELATLLTEADRAGKAKRKKTLQTFDQAAVLLRDALLIVLDPTQEDLDVSDHRKTYFFGLSPTGHRSRQPRLWRGIGGNGSVQRLNRPQIEHRQRVGERRGAGELIVPPP